MKRLTAILLCVLLTASMLLGCGRKKAALIEQPENLYVADEAEVLSQSTKDYVVSRVAALKQACGGEIAVVTLDYLNDLTAEEYAYTLFNQWGIGDRTKNNGMMVLIVIGENACWLTPGYGIEDDFPSTQCTDYLGRYLWQYQNAGDCDTGVIRLIDALIDWYCSYYKVTVAGVSDGLITDFAIDSGYGSPYPESAQQAGDSLFSGSGILTLLAIGFVIFLVLQSFSGKPRKRSYFIPLVVANSILNHSSGNHHSSSGGSAVHHSSSGSCHVGSTPRPGGHFGGGGTHGGGGGFKG